MKTTTASALLGMTLAVSVHANLVPVDDLEARDVDTRYPYTGPAVPIGDCKIFRISYSRF
jgi:hypothetical protein